MKIDNKMWIFLAVVLVAAIAIGSAYFFQSANAPQETSQQKELKVDDLLAEIEDESVITNQEDSDANLINADDNEINELGNSAEENEF